MIKKYSVLVSSFVVILMLTACGNVLDTHENEVVQNQQGQYSRNQPIPYFEWSLERHMMIELYSARNNAVSTWSYIWDQYRGKISFECPSIGYPIPGGTQLTNPEQLGNLANVTGIGTVPQAEPNGLFSPDTAEGTYVMCLNDDGSVSPTYLEENVRTFPYPMVEENGKLVRVKDKASSVKIDPHQPSQSAISPTPSSTATPIK